jgi:hypothetical protein
MARKKAILVCEGDAYGDCGKPALYVRHTQFAGDHPFCMFHALAEPDFLEDDSYKFWEKIDPADNGPEQQNREV